MNASKGFKVVGIAVVDGSDWYQIILPVVLVFLIAVLAVVLRR